MPHDDKLLFLTDTTVNVNPSAVELAQIAIQTAFVAEKFQQKPRRRPGSTHTLETS